MDRGSVGANERDRMPRGTDTESLKKAVPEGLAWVQPCDPEPGSMSSARAPKNM